MNISLPVLPYSLQALDPFLSQETLEYHYNKHHNAYVVNLRKLIINTEFAEMKLEDIVKTSSGNIFNNAAQIWNHTFYWNCLTPSKSVQPSKELFKLLERYFGNLSTFKEKFNQVAISTFGSGWAWLVQNEDGSLEIISTNNANTPFTTKQKPLLTCDVWEHAYYIDYRNSRPAYLEAFWQIINWDFITQNLR